LIAAGKNLILTITTPCHDLAFAGRDGLYPCSFRGDYGGGKAFMAGVEGSADLWSREGYVKNRI